MPRLELSGGFYQARSVIANNQRCVNLFPERNPEDAPTKFTHYPTPGLRLLSEGGGEPLRGTYMSSAGQFFIVEGQKLQFVNSAWQRFDIGTLAVDAVTPVSMQDNGSTLVVVDGSAHGYTVDLASYAFGEISDPAFYGADAVGYLDTFLLFNRPGTRQFYWGPSNGVVPFDPLDVASKTAYPDPLASLAVMRREIWLPGTQKATEIWSDVGGVDPFQIVAGAYIEQACVAKYSIATNDLLIFWLGTNKAGKATVYIGSNYVAKKISTPAIAKEFSKYTLSDAIGMIYQQDDHVFYMLVFPTDGRTWVYDASEGFWHERTWTDADGVERRHRANCCALAYGEIAAGDWENGNLYAFDTDKYTDDGVQIVRRRGFPHVSNDGKRLVVDRFACDMQAGESASDDPTPIYLRWSTNKGRTWGEPVELQLGAQGEFGEQPYFRDAGLGRDFVFELFWSADANTALNSAWIDTTPAGS